MGLGSSRLAAGGIVHAGTDPDEEPPVKPLDEPLLDAKPLEDPEPLEEPPPEAPSGESKGPVVGAVFPPHAMAARMMTAATAARYAFFMRGIVPAFRVPGKSRPLGRRDLHQVRGPSRRHPDRAN